MFWSLYLIAIADGLKALCGTIGWLTIIGYFIIFLTALINYIISKDTIMEDIEKSHHFFILIKKKIYIVIISSALIFSAVLIPSTKNLLIIFGVTKFSQSEIFNQTNEIAQKSLKLLNQKLDGFLTKEGENK